MTLRDRICRSRMINKVNAILIMAVIVTTYYSLHLMVQRMEHLERRIDRELSSAYDRENITEKLLQRPGEEEPKNYIYNFTIDISNLEKCKDEKVFLLIIVTTAPQNHRHRFEIRQTWGNVSNVFGANIKTVFAVGKPTNRAAQVALEQENRLHHDIIQGDFVDSYRNLTLKTMLCLKWAIQYCPQARYVLKADDDTFVSIFTLVKHLQELPSDPKDFVTSWVYEGRAPLRDPNFMPKWYVSEKEYSRDVYPKYPSGFLLLLLYCLASYLRLSAVAHGLDTTQVSGTSKTKGKYICMLMNMFAYVLSNDITVKIYKAALDIKYFFLEDVYIGLCLEKLGISPVHHSGFFPEFVPIPSCKVDWLLASHWVKEPEVMLSHWANQNTDCSLVSEDHVDEQT
ncbi:beta-1,3-galactosyltransferase 5-like [Branchiostoma lanceolatum]|uniref:beta-1,3-galactosyltransferase 5-like n=1 Tax=Branchiostoma lanceolatum TaxID=7740 RepID=UPI00345686E5